MHHATDKGFSFLEILGATVILAMSMVVLMDNQTRSMDLTQRALVLDQATTLAESKMAELVELAARRGITELRTQDEGEFEGEGGGRFKWRYVTRPVPSPDFAAIFANNTSEGDQASASSGSQAIIPILEQNWSQALTEIQVDVFWTQGRSERSFNLVTHWVDPAVSTKFSTLVQAMVAQFSGGGGGGGGEPN